MDSILENIGEVVSILADLVQVTAVLVAGAWTWKRFIRTREDASCLDVTAGLEVIGEHMALTGPAYLAVVTATVRNTGKVRHTIAAMHFDLRVVQDDDLLARSEAVIDQVAFPRKLYDEQRFFPASWTWSFVEPGATNIYRYSVILPADARFALVNVKLPLAGDDEFFTSWKIIALERSPGEPVLSLSRGEVGEEMVIPADPYDPPGMPARWAPTQGFGGMAGMARVRL